MGWLLRRRRARSLSRSGWLQPLSKHNCDRHCQFLFRTVTPIELTSTYAQEANYEKGNNMSLRTSGQQPVKLAKSLTNIDALALGFGAMIGFGWVVLTGGWIENRSEERRGGGDGRQGKAGWA